MALSQDQLNTEIDVTLPDNTTKAIAPVSLRTVLHDIVNNPVVSPGGGASVSSANFVSTLTAAKATTFPTVANGGPEWVMTQGYAAVGDNGGMLSTRISSPPTGTTAGTWSSADGQLWLYVPNGTEVHVNAFGATRMASDSDYSVDSYQAFSDCRDWILKHVAPAGVGGTTGITMVWDGYYYCSKSFQTGQGNYNIRGQSRTSRITTPWPYDQIIVHGSNTFGREGSPYSSAFPVYYGQRSSIGTHVYVCVTAGTPSGTTPPSGTGVGQVDGTVVWNYERELAYHETLGGAFNGTIERLTVASNWSVGGTPHATGIEATHPSDDQNNLATEGAYFSGILGRSRCTTREVSYFGQPGMGIAFVANGDPYLRGAANTNDWRIDRCGGGFLGWNGIHVGLKDSNAGVAIDIDSVDCGAFGIANFAFLDNKFYGTQHDGDGQFFRGFSKYPTSSVHRGYHWLVRLPELGVDNLPLYLNEEPGAAPVSLRKPWIRWEGDGTISYATLTASISGTTLTVTVKSGSNLNVGATIYDGGVSAGTKITALGTGTGGTGTYTINNSQTVASTTMHADTYDDGNYLPWLPTQRYMPGGSHGNSNFNNCGTVFGQYNESGTWPAQFGVKDIVIGTILQGLYDTTRGNLVLEAGVWRRSVMAEARYASDAGVKFRTVGIGAVPVDGQQSARADSPVLFHTDYDGTYYELGSSAENELGTTGDRTLHNDFDWGPLNQLKWLRLSGKNTLRDYGRGVPFPYATHIPNLILGDTFLGGRRLFTVTGIPSGGPFAVGDIAVNTSGTVGQPKAWTCTAAPTTSTSTWTSWGNL
jgi:hypothetical protein